MPELAFELKGSLSVMNVIFNMTKGGFKGDELGAKVSESFGIGIGASFGSISFFDVAIECEE